MAKLKYSKSLPGKMYRFFRDYDDQGTPSLVKFALTLGTTTEVLESFRKYKEFDRAYRECCEIKRDYLIDRALSKRFDPSFVKFLLQGDEERASSEENESLTVNLVVSE